MLIKNIIYTEAKLAATLRGGAGIYSGIETILGCAVYRDTSRIPTMMKSTRQHPMCSSWLKRYVSQRISQNDRFYSER